MATTDYGVTAADVQAKLPLSNPLTATTKPVSTSDVDEFIDDADSQMSGVLRNAGISLDDLDDDTTRQVQEAIKNYAAAQALSALNVRGQLQSQMMDQWREVYQRYQQRPQLLTKRVTRIKHNVDTDDSATTAGFVGRDYKY